jgi:hypothetical protein
MNLIYEEAVGTNLEYRIELQNKAVNLDGASVQFKMREHDSAQLHVDNDATIADATRGEVAYTWEASDLDIPGEYLGWFEVDLGSALIVTPEFQIIIAEHAPGIRTRTGAIYRAAKSYIPETWGNLERLDYYGDAVLQEKINLIKEKILVDDVLVDDEEDLNIRIIDYLAKLAVIAVIPAGADYWANQRIEVSATGTNETATYPDRAKALWELHKRLIVEVNQDRAEIEELLGNELLRSSVGTPAISDGAEEGFITPLPSEHFRDYAFPDWDYRTAGRKQSGSFWYGW